MYSDENIIKKNLYDWFLDQDSLIIPDLGRFEAQYNGATLLPTVSKALPPNKAITFDSSVKFDDGTLANYLVEKEKISEDEAKTAVKNFTHTVKNELANYKKYEIHNFGSLVEDEEGSLRFQSNQELNYLGDSFGLPDLYNLQPATGLENGKSDYNGFSDKKEKAPPKSEEKVFPKDDFDIELEEDNTTDTSSRRLLVVMGVLILTVSSAVAYFIISGNNPFFGEGAQSNLVENNNEVENDEAINDPNPDNEAIENQEGNEENNLPDDTSPVDDKELPPIVTYPTDNRYVSSFSYNPNPPKNLNDILVKDKTARFYIVLGSFDNPLNAYSFYNNLVNKGVANSKIVAPSGSNKRYRVTHSDYTNKEEARNQAVNFGKANALSLWILAH